MISRLLILAIGLALMILFQLIKFILEKKAPTFYGKIKKFLPWIIFACVFIALYITYAVKFKNYLPFDALIDGLSITAIAVLGYDLLKPIFNKIVKKGDVK